MAENFNFLDNIRDSFGKVHQQTVPKALQEQLFARLEQEGLMSEKEEATVPDNSIKTAFEETFITTAPSHVWNHIESNLTEAADIDFQENIKQSFIQSHQSAAPFDVWGEISEQISIDSEDKPHGNLIKDSFEEKYGKTAPDYIWNAVREQINMDKVWERIVQALDAMQRRELWQARLRRWMSYAALLLLMHACLPTHYLGLGLKESLPKQPLVNLPERLNEKESNENITKPSAINKLETKEAQIKDKVPSNNSLKPIVAKERIEEEVPALIVAEKVESPSPSNNSLKPIVAKDPIEEEVPAPVLAEKVDEPAVEKELIVDVNLSDKVLAVISLNQINIAPKLKLDTSILELALTMPIKKQKRIEEEDLQFRNSIGLIASSGVGLAFNEETKLGFEATSLVSTAVAPALSLGFAGTYAFSHQSALSYELYANSQIKQELHYYSKAGRYNQQKHELNYVRLAAMYQQRLLHYGRLSGVKSEVLGKVGGYAAYLRAQRAFENEILTTTMPNYRKLDFGLQLMLGQRHRLNRIVLEYGVVGNMGLYNIFNGPSSLANLSVQNTRLLHAGGYLSLQYLF